MTWQEKFDKKFVDQFAGVPCVCKVNADVIYFYLPEELKAFFQSELEALAKECIGEELLDGYGDKLKMVAETGYNVKRREVIEAFKKRGIN
jgi:hypothetical protein